MRKAATDLAGFSTTVQCEGEGNLENIPNKSSGKHALLYTECLASTERGNVVASDSHAAENHDFVFALHFDEIYADSGGSVKQGKRI